jgi:hypothetical protein
MKHISYISLIAMVSIGVALFYVIYYDIAETTNISRPDMTLKYAEFSGIPYFFGISLFMFEGNALTTEIYH